METVRSTIQSQAITSALRSMAKAVRRAESRQSGKMRLNLRYRSRSKPVEPSRTKKINFPPRPAAGLTSSQLPTTRCVEAKRRQINPPLPVPAYSNPFQGYPAKTQNPKPETSLSSRAGSNPVAVKKFLFPPSVILELGTWNLEFPTDRA